MTSSDATYGIFLKSLTGTQSIELKGVMTVGRGAASDVVIEQERLSRKHAQLTVTDNTLLVEDLGSTNSTFINDVKTVGVVTAKHGDIIKFDTFAYQVCVVTGNDDATQASGLGSEEVLEAKTQMFVAPKSWALDNDQSTDGTLVMSLDSLKSDAGEKDLSLAADIEHDTPVLVCLNGKMKGKIFKFNTRDKLTKWEIGRSPECDICVDEASVSTNHAQLIHEGKRWKLVDLMSANGTFVNGNKGLTSYLSSGDEVKFGQINFMFKVGGNAGDVTAPHAQVEAAVVEPVSKPIWLFAVAGFLVTAVALYFVIL